MFYLTSSLDYECATVEPTKIYMIVPKLASL